MTQFIADLLDVAGFPGMRQRLDQEAAHRRHLARVATGIIYSDGGYKNV